MPHADFGVSAPTPSWLTERARAEAAKAPPPSPRLIAEVAPLMGWIPAPAPLAGAA
jgi:hypothetical protein